MLTTWSPNAVATKIMSKVQLDMSHKSSAAPANAAAPAAGSKPNWATDFTSLFCHHRVGAWARRHAVAARCRGAAAAILFFSAVALILLSFPPHPSSIAFYLSLQIVVASGERDLWFYDLTSYEPLLVVCRNAFSVARASWWPLCPRPMLIETRPLFSRLRTWRRRLSSYTPLTTTRRAPAPC